MTVANHGLSVPKDFTHLEVHSHYTMLGATPSIGELVSRAKADGLSHLALTDSNCLYGAVAFDLACREAGIGPILGLKISVAAPDKGDSIASRSSPGKLILLARNPAGYRSLCRLSSQVQGQKNRVKAIAVGLTWKDLQEHNDGLLCLSSGQSGWIARLLKEGNSAEAGRYVSKLADVYGENAYLGLEIHQPEDLELAREIVALGGRFGLPSVAVQPVYYLDPEDQSKLRLLKAIDRNCRVEAVTDNLADRHWLHADEIAQRFADIPEALVAIGEIVNRCGRVLPDGRTVFPSIDIDTDSGEADSADDYLSRSANEGLRAKYGSPPPRSISARLNKELNSIATSGYATLFLIVSDIVRFSRANDIPVSTRGSVANSLVAFCAGITTVDPIAHDLLFERFINPARINPPDIDLDFCSRRRDLVLEYVRETYGKDKVALVATISTMQPKSAVRETAKAFGLDHLSTDQLVKRLPSRWRPDPRRRDRPTMLDLVEEFENEKMREVIVAASEIVGQPHHLSIHPGGVVITPGPLTDYVPLQWAPKGFLVTQFDYKDLESIGLPKLDLLGIRALTVLADAADLVREHYDPGFRIEEIDLEDPVTGDLLEAGRSIGVFQCESAGAQRTMRQLKARTVQDLAIANAFFKPGPASGGMAQAFIRRYRGEEKVEYLHPALEPILNSTQGVLLFQEQILRVATEIARLSWEQADHLRRGMSKFKPEEMEALQSDFVQGCQRPPPEGPGFSQVQARTLWQQVRAFAGYGFNRGHATAYGDVSYRSAFLKAHWPEAFLCARLADGGGFHHLAIYMAEATRLGIQINPPHVNFSGRKFTLSYDSEKTTNSARESELRSPIPDPQTPLLWLGLGQVRDLRRKSVKKIIEERETRRFKDLSDLLVRVPLQQKEIIHLIRCGALDDLGPNRATLEDEAMVIKRAGTVQQISFDFARGQIEKESAAERLVWEQFILGQPVSVHPLDLVENLPPNLTPLSQLESNGVRSHGGRTINVIGVRLPGWTGGPGFFLGDRDTFVVVRQGKKVEQTSDAPEAWKPLLVRGRWTRDEWGTKWLQADRIKAIS